MKIACPLCGTEFQPAKPEAHVACQHCRHSLFIDLDGVVPVFTFKSAIEPHSIGSYLKKFLKNRGFDEDVRVISSIPVYIPFWNQEGAGKLKRGCSLFPADEIALPANNRISFDRDRVDFRIEVLDIDTQPGDQMKQTLYYYPFFKLNVVFREQNLRFFINAINGDVFEESITRIPGRNASRLFPLFLVIFSVFLAVNYFFNQLLVSVLLNLILGFFFFMVSMHLIENTMQKNE